MKNPLFTLLREYPPRKGSLDETAGQQSKQCHFELYDKLLVRA